MELKHIDQSIDFTAVYASVGLQMTPGNAPSWLPGGSVIIPDDVWSDSLGEALKEFL